MPAMKTDPLIGLSCAVLLVVFAPATHAAKEDAACPNVAFGGDSRRWAQPWVVVPPTYPPELLQAGRTGIVDVEAHVPLSARVSEIQKISSDPPTPEFEAAVTAVLKLWFFYRETGCDCVPKASDVKLRVWFEVKEGKPSVSISSRSAEKPLAGPGTPVLLNRPEIAEIIQRSYPRQARREGAQADVYAAAKLDADSGSVEKVDVTWMDAPHSLKGTFERAVVSGLAQAKFKTDKSANPDPQFCFAISYRLSR